MTTTDGRRRRRPEFLPAPCLLGGWFVWDGWDGGQSEYKARVLLLLLLLPPTLMPFFLFLFLSFFDSLIIFNWRAFYLLRLNAGQKM